MKENKVFYQKKRLRILSYDFLRRKVAGVFTFPLTNYQKQKEKQPQNNLTPDFLFSTEESILTC